jgi:hypothetical protein
VRFFFVSFEKFNEKRKCNCQNSRVGKLYCSHDIQEQQLNYFITKNEIANYRYLDQQEKLKLLQNITFQTGDE